MNRKKNNLNDFMFHHNNQVSQLHKQQVPTYYYERKIEDLDTSAEQKEN